MPPIEVVPETLKLVISVISPPKTALPIIVSAFEPPAMVELVVTVVPSKVIVTPAPVIVTAPV